MWIFVFDYYSRSIVKRNKSRKHCISSVIIFYSGSVTILYFSSILLEFVARSLKNWKM